MPVCDGNARFLKNVNAMKRATFLAASASFGAIGSTGAAAQDIPGGTHLVEPRSDFDEGAFAAAVGRKADVRQLWEAVSFHPQIFNNVKNALNGLQFGFGYAADRIALVVAPHGASSAYTYTDYIWSKYRIGEALKLRDASGSPVSSNVFLPSHSADAGGDPDASGSVFQDTSIQALQRRGVVFLTCHTAVEEQARMLVDRGYAGSGATASGVAADMLTHLIEGAIVVPAMVAAIAVLQQRFGYSYVTLTFA